MWFPLMKKMTDWIGKVKQNVYSSEPQKAHATYGLTKNECCLTYDLFSAAKQVGENQYCLPLYLTFYSLRRRFSSYSILLCSCFHASVLGLCNDIKSFKASG